VEGLPQGAKPSLFLQLSSPIEEGILDTVYDPLNNQDPVPEGSVVVFRGVEPTVATLTVSAKDADIPLGSSSTHDIAPICALDPMDIKEKYITELPIAIVADDGSATSVKGDEEITTTTTAAVEETAEKTEVVTVTATVEEMAVVQPICTVTLRITYKPSPKDQREELYELLNKTSQRKAAALENLRQISMQAAAVNRASPGSPTASPESSTAMTKPAVKPGFLNKKKDKEDGRLRQLYDRTMGPDSLLRRGALFVFAAKDFFIFFGAVTFFHFQGQMLALPPPV
jgi:hypothetical protein